MSEPVTIIGANTVVNGNLEGDEDLTIEGRVEGTINLSRTVTIDVNGVVHANINVRNAVISGILVGNVEAEDSVHVTEEGRVMGDISAPRVILVDGASFRGSIDMGDFDVERAEGVPSSKSTGTRPAAVSYASDEEDEQEEPKAERVRTRVRTVPAAAKTPASRPTPRAAPKPKPKPKPAKAAPTAKAKKKAPAPKVRSVGKAKTTRKKR